MAAPPQIRSAHTSRRRPSHTNGRCSGLRSSRFAKTNGFSYATISPCSSPLASLYTHTDTHTHTPPTFNIIHYDRPGSSSPEIILWTENWTSRNNTPPTTILGIYVVYIILLCCGSILNRRPNSVWGVIPQRLFFITGYTMLYNIGTRELS